MKARSSQKEILDLGPEHYSQTEYETCLDKLFLVGKYSGMHRDTFCFLEKLAPKTVLDVGCGDGAFLAAVSKRFPAIECLGIDISSDAIRYAAKNHSSRVSFMCTDRLQPVDVIMANLVCHHMTDVELKEFLQTAYECATKAVLINDLQRHRLAKLAFCALSGPLFSNRLISHDGKISIERGFCRDELRALFAGIAPDSYQIAWRFPFRWQAVLWKR